MLKEIKCFCLEHIENRHYILKLAKSRAKEETKNTTLGIYWDVVRDAVFFVAYAFFMTVIRPGNSFVDGMPRLIYLFTGLVAWYFISDFLNKGVNCILKNKNIFTKIKFPILIIPTIEATALFMRRFITVVMLAVILIMFLITTDFQMHINILGLLYAFVSLYMFGVVYSLFMSGFYSISKDFRSLYKAIVRIQFYFTPIFWSISDIESLSAVPNWVAPILENTPIIYLVNTFREALILNQVPSLLSIGIFSTILLVMFTLGCYIQYRLRRIYADFV